METKKTTSLTFRVHEDVKAVLEAVASDELRSVSQQVELFIRTGLQEYAKSHPKRSQRILEALRSAYGE